VVIQKAGYKKSNNEQISLKLDVNTYDLFCRYILQENRAIRIEHLVALRNLINSINPVNYENDPELFKRVNFIKKGLEARIDNNLNDRDIVLNYINGGISFELDFIDYDRLILSKTEIEYITTFIFESLKWNFIYANADNMIDLLTRFKTSDFYNKQDIVPQIGSMVNMFQNNFREMNFISNATDMMFSLEDGDFENCITETYNMVTNPSRRLQSGMQGLNEMIGGGFESGRVYMFLGTSGIGKSKLLLNIMYQIKNYNNMYKPKDPSKKPCVVMLTMENTVVETITRLYDLAVENNYGMANYSCEEVINQLRNEGQLKITDSSPIDLIIIYKPNKSVDTSYLYTLCDNLEDRGKEVICIIQDHVKRIRSIDRNSDVRLELGDIVNEMKSFAAIKDIPVITCSHLNRDASRTLEELERKKNQDTGKALGKSNIGESMLMIDNLDFGIIITLDYDKEDRLYMAFNAVKTRAKTQRTYIVQPFIPGNTMRLVEDVGGIPQFKESIHTQLDMNRAGNSIIKISGASSMTESMNLSVNNDVDEENTFNKKSYVIDEEKEERKIIKPLIFMNEESGFVNNIKLDIGNIEEILGGEEDG
jgi:RecA/RadA recombinase